MHFKSDNKIDSNRQQKYLDTNQIDYNKTNKLVIENFLLNNNELSIVTTQCAIFCQIFLVTISYKR